MKVTALSKTHDHLSANRRRIIGRSLAAAVAGALPVPLLEEWLAATIRRGTIKKLAEFNQVDIEDAAIRAIADGFAKPPEWTEIAGGSLLYKILSRSWRRLLIGVLAARRAKAAAHTFLICTLFDHYCLRLHVGTGIDGDTGVRLRALMDKTIAETPGGLSRRAFRRGAIAAAKATLKAPIEIADIASRGAVRRLLTRGDEVEATSEVNEHLERQLAANKSFLSRAAVFVELQLTSEQNPYLDDLLDAFEKAWRQSTSIEKDHD